MQAYPPPPRYNPDTRPLPEGWLTQHDPNFNQWFYVDTRTNPPHTTWIHPAGPVPPVQAPMGFAPPTTSPNYSGYNGPPPYDRGAYDQPYSGPPDNGSKGLFGGLGGSGNPNNSGVYPGNVYPGGPGVYQQPTQVVYSQAPQKSGRMGMGTGLALGVGGGLLGGMLLENALDDSYDQGFDNGGDFGGDF